MNEVNFEELLKDLDSESLKKLQELALKQKDEETAKIRSRISELETELSQLRALLPSDKKPSSNAGVSRPRTGITKWLLERVTREGTNQEILNEISQLFPDSDAKLSAVAWARAKANKAA
jgi:Asp-tRNA(Asn)/Glu-tRNA(Gln) amidotransferase C subunit